MEDNWRVTQKLTINLGIRYDIEVPRTERYNQMTWFDPSAPAPIAKNMVELFAPPRGLNLDFDSVRAAGSLLGSAAVMVMHEDTCMVDVLKTAAHFYHHESCGQCTPCREGCGWIEKLLIDLEDGRGKMEDLQVLLDVAVNMEGNTICVLADSLSMPVKSLEIDPGRTSVASAVNGFLASMSEKP